MSHITLTDEQMRVVAGAGATVEVRDPQGRPLAQLTPLDPADVEAVERWRQLRGHPRPPGIPSAQVQAHLRRLEEIDRDERLDEARMRDLLQRLQAGEQP